MPSWLAGGNQAPLKHLGQFASGSSLLCEKLMLHLDFRRREMFRVCFPLGLPSPCFGGYVAGFESVFEHGCISALCSAAFVSMWEGRELAVSLHKSFLATALHSASFLQHPHEFQKVPKCGHEQHLLLLQEGIFTNVSLSLWHSGSPRQSLCRWNI